MATADKIPGFEKIPNILGYMLLDDDQIMTSGGELENNEEVAKIAHKIALVAAKVPVHPIKKDTFKRISMVVEDKYEFMITVSTRRVYIVKRKYVADENQQI